MTSLWVRETFGDLDVGESLIKATLFLYKLIDSSAYLGQSLESLHGMVRGVCLISVNVVGLRSHKRIALLDAEMMQIAHLRSQAFPSNICILALFGGCKHIVIKLGPMDFE